MHEKFAVQPALVWTVSAFCLVICVFISSLSGCGLKLKSSTDYLISGQEYFKASDYKHAENEYKEALRLEPNNATAKNNLGVILSEEGKFSEAITILQEAIALDPNNAIARYVLSSALTKTGQFDEALAQAQKATQLDPNESQGYKALGDAALGKGDTDLPVAITAFREAIKLEPDNDGHHHRLAVALARTGDWDGAIGEDKKALELNSENTFARISLAVALQQKGSTAAAVDELKKVLEKEPTNVTARQALDSMGSSPAVTYGGKPPSAGLDRARVGQK